MKTSPLVSVIIPVYNCEQYLAAAIQSVVDQTYSTTEIIVVDDGSTDGTCEIVKRSFPSVRYCYQDNSGTGAARNRGIAMAQGSFFAFLDADDFWLNNKLADQMKVFRNNPDTEIVFGHVKQFLCPKLDEITKKKLRCSDELMPGFLPCTMLIKRDSFFHVGLFETSWQVGQDVSWILRAKEHELRMIMLPDLVYMRRLHKNNKGITHRHFIKDRVRILKSSIDRRRKKKIADDVIRSQDDES
ncbi:MAG: glycosyltransferase family 2 protein [Planctomycetota bacterium]